MKKIGAYQGKSPSGVVVANKAPARARIGDVCGWEANNKENIHEEEHNNAGGDNSSGEDNAGKNINSGGTGAPCCK